MKTESALQAKPFLDAFSRALSSAGASESVGRVMGWLLICEPACQTLSEISSVVQQPLEEVQRCIQAMEIFGVVESVPLRDERGTCFAMKAVSQMIEQRFSKLGEIRQAIETGLALMKDEPPEARERLQELHDVYARMEELAPQLKPSP